MSRYVVDIEGDDLLEGVSVIHSLVLKDIDTRAVFSCADQPGYLPIEHGLQRIREATLVVGHNILCYDEPALKKVRRLKLGKGTILRCTLLMARLKWPEIMTLDMSGSYEIPGHLKGDFSLEAFGYRLRCHKGNFKGPWKTWSPEMQKYCEQDVEVTYLLWLKLQENYDWSAKTLLIEHEFQRYIHEQEVLGAPFSERRARELHTPLKARIDSLISEIQSAIPPREIRLKTKVRYEPFNPGSRQQIVRFLSERYSWEPTVFTDKGNPSVDGDVLQSLPFPEAKLFADFFELQKLLGMLSTGNNSWLKYVRNDRLHGRVITCGAVTRRCTHSSPNLANIPSVRAFMGKEVRSLFYAPEGYRMVGTDAKSLELRCLSHYLARYDNGTYGRDVIDGDVHTKNAEAVGLARDPAKTFIYALLYGAGDAKLGELFVPGGSEEQKKAAGAKARGLFKEKIRGYKELSDALRQRLSSGSTLRAIDGGTLQVRHKHAALNTLLQSAGSIAVKQATVFARRKHLEKGLEVYPALHVHDEWQSIVKESDAEEAGRLNVQAIKEAGEELGFSVPLDGEYKVGMNWAETH
jgi:DNA polymerase-1